MRFANDARIVLAERGPIVLLCLSFAIIVSLCNGCASDAYCNLPEVDSVELEIIGGTESTDRRSAVLVMNVTDEGVSFCTGAIISAHTVLTAAHCAIETDHLYVRNVTTDTNYKVVSRVKHVDADLLVLHTERVLPLPYAELAYHGLQCTPGLIAQGFGRDENGDFWALKEREVYETHHNNEFIFTTEGICFGDSGGSLYAETPEGLRVVGVASFVRTADCRDRRRVPRKGTAGFVNVINYAPWITENIK